MGILDEAIKEHLELKKHNGADESELSKLEAEAFGASARPGEASIAAVADEHAAEAPTEFLATAPAAEPAAEDETGAPVAEGQPAAEAGPTDLDPAPLSPDAIVATPEVAPPESGVDTSVPSSVDDDLDLDAPGASSEGNSATAEREAIASHPTEHYDVPAEHKATEASEPAPPSGAPPEPQVPLDTETFGGSPFDETAFFDQQTLSDELDKALDAPPHPDDQWDEESSDAEPLAPAGAAPAAPVGPPEPSSPAVDPEPTPFPDEPETGSSFFDDGEGDVKTSSPAPLGPDEDVLEDTPEFLRDAPESDSLWFDQKPPKDFDFDD